MIRALLCLFSFATSLLAKEPQFIYSVYTGDAGCIAEFGVDTQAGKFIPASKIFENEESFRMTTLLRVLDSSEYVYINKFTDQPIVGKVNIQAAIPTVEKLVLSDRPRQIVYQNLFGYVTGHKGLLHKLKFQPLRIIDSVDTRNIGESKSSRPEALAISPDGTRLITASLYDDSDGKSFGNRIQVYSSIDLRLLGELELPRDKANLHIAKTEINGPGPHWLVISEASNTLAVGLENYGAVALFDLDRALQGEIENLTYLSTARDGEFGVTFPVGALLFQHADKDHLFVSHASESGDSAIIDLQSRSVVAHIPTGPRASAIPIHLPETQQLIAVKSGFQKTRTDHGLDENHEDQRVVQIVDLRELGNQPELPTETVELKDYAYHITAVPGTEQFVILGLRVAENNAMEFALFDLQKKEIVDTTESLGVLRTVLPVLTE